MALTQGQLDKNGFKVVRDPTGRLFVVEPANNAAGFIGVVHEITDPQNLVGVTPVDLASLPGVRTGNVTQNYLYGRPSGEVYTVDKLVSSVNRYEVQSGNAQRASDQLAASNAKLALGGDQSVAPTATPQKLTDVQIAAKNAAADANNPGATRNYNPQVSNVAEPTSIRTNADGTIEFYGVRSGRVYQSFPKGTDTGTVLAAQNTVTSGFSEAPRSLDSGSTSGSTSSGATSGTGSYSGGSTLEDYTADVAAYVDNAASTAESQGFTVTPEMRAAYLEQARTELEPYYGEVIRLAELDLGTSLSRLVEDARASEATLTRQYGQSLTNTQSSLQNRGMLYGGGANYTGGVRGQEEQALADTYNEQFAGLGKNFDRNLQDTSLAFEKDLGSSAALEASQSLGTTQEVGRVLAGTPTFSLGADTNIFKPVGDLYGDINRDQTYNEQTRANSLETAERDLFSTYV